MTDRIVPIRDADFLYGFVPFLTGPRWRLNVDYPFTVKSHDGMVEWSYVIPAGYEFDKASVPPVFWGLGFTPSGVGELAALEHDFLCDLLTGGSEWLKGAIGDPGLPPAPPPDVVHDHFQRRCVELGVRRSKAWVMGWAVKLFGPKGKLRPSRYL